jgi:preprotein translocase subunit SecG
MNAKTFFRTLGFLLILLLVILITTENTDQIKFHFSLLLPKPVQASAAFIYFAMFAVGVIGGTLLHGGGSGGGGGPSKGKK